MAFQREVKQEDGWLHLITQGRIDNMEDFLAKVHLGVDMVSCHNCRRVLVDDRGVEVLVDALSVYTGIDQLAESGLPSKGLKIAGLCRPEDKSVFKMIETAYRNRSVNYRLFVDDEAAALEWLTS